MRQDILIPLLIMAAIPAAIFLLRRLRRPRQRKVVVDGVSYSLDDGRFVGPDGHLVTSPTLVATLAAMAGVPALSPRPAGRGTDERGNPGWTEGGMAGGASGGEGDGGASGSDGGGGGDGGSGGGDGGGVGGGRSH